MVSRQYSRLLGYLTIFPLKSSLLINKTHFCTVIFKQPLFILSWLQYYCVGKGKNMADEQKVLDNLMQRLRHVHSEGNQPLCPEALQQTHWCKTTLLTSAQPHGLPTSTPSLIRLGGPNEEQKIQTSTRRKHLGYLNSKPQFLYTLLYNEFDEEDKYKGYLMPFHVYNVETIALYSKIALCVKSSAS